jgi:antitoxin HigA-1
MIAIKLDNSFAVHPGVWLPTEVVEPSVLSVTELAAYLRVTRQVMRKLLNCKAGLTRKWLFASRRRLD